MRDDFTKGTVHVLGLRVGFRCSNPQCMKATSGPRTDPTKAVSIGVAAHITAASEGGPRYNPNLTSEQRRNPENGIWLCQNCAKLVDNDPDRYSVDLLKGWKLRAERAALIALEYGVTPGSAPVFTTPFNLPSDLADFSGRQGEIEEVICLLDHERALAISSVHGMGGVGKTALAIHIAHHLASTGNFQDAQLYIDLKGTDLQPIEPVAALDSLLTALIGPDPHRPQDIDGLACLWRAVVHGRDVFLLLDNAASANQVRPLLPGSTTCTVLITSRRSFKLPGARLLNLNRMNHDEACRFLKSLAPHLDDVAADKISVMCGDLPLALRIAGNHLSLNDDVAPADYAAVLSDERQRLASLRDPSDPDLDVEAALGLSVSQLDAETRRDWAMLALLPAPFDASAAAALWEHPASDEMVLARLQDFRSRSLLTYDSETKQYHQHDLLRLVAAKELEHLEISEIRSARMRLSEHYFEVLKVHRETERSSRLDPYIPHLNATLEYTSREDPEMFSELVVYLQEWWSIRGMPHASIEWCSRAAQVCADAGLRREEGIHLGNLACAYRDTGELELARTYYEKALAISREVGDRRQEGNWEGNLATIDQRQGNYEKAIALFDHSLEIAWEIDDKTGQSTRLGNLGMTYAEMGQVPKGISYLRQALRVAQEIEDLRAMGRHLSNLAFAYAEMGNLPAAIERWELALKMARDLEDRRGEARRLINLSSASLTLGDLERAEELGHEALTTSEDISDPFGKASALAVLGQVAIARGDIVRACELLNLSLSMHQKLGYPGSERIRNMLLVAGCRTA